MPSLLRRALLLLACSAACTDRTQPSSDLGRRFAQHLCAIQAECGCDEDLLIPNCEARVERELLESERRALAAGLELDEACVEETLEYIDALTSCDPSPVIPGCPVYTARAEVGEACEVFDVVPWISDCRTGLSCIRGTCRDLLNLHILYEGELCSDTQADRATGELGECAIGLVCDSEETRTCVPSPHWPPVPTGGECPTLISCVEESYCHTEDVEHPSEESPGICTLRTPEGQACTHPLECTTRCTDGFCEARPPRLCELLDEWWAREGL